MIPACTAGFIFLPDPMPLALLTSWIYAAGECNFGNQAA
jgi:hypothetical protein